MMNKHSIDIVVPTFRLDEELLLGIINLDSPPEFDVFIYIVSDNPGVVIPESLQRLNETGTIKLLVNARNEGAPGTRNTGIRAGTSKWVMLLDDDIKPQSNLLFVYAAATREHENAIGFAGVTRFPKAINAATRALEINGTIASFTDAMRKPYLAWAPTSNVMLNREKMHPDLFDASLVNSEDVDFLTRNSLHFEEKYLPLPLAVVFHPWWNNGKMQTARILSYGAGASQIARKPPACNYTFRDFTNTSETILILILLFPFAYFSKQTHFLLICLTSLLIAEFMTNWIKGINTGKTWSLPVAFHLMWVKNCYEFSYLYTSLSQGYINGFGQRIEMGFNKPNPSPFRTNRWKIIKTAILLILFLVAAVAT